ncbi:MAG: hypothetical protein H0X38_00950 [Planctomycetes bacterium]|nr:hypothetical protein [Planctomycetota bacterium]
MKSISESSRKGRTTAALTCRYRPVALASVSASYNGACEAGNGTIKLLTHELACRHDRPAAWTLDDLEAARLLANRRITDRDQTRTPEARFADRMPITPAERMRLATAIAGERTRRAEDSEIASAHGVRKIRSDALEREAIAAALSGTGVITIRSRRVRLSYPKVGT